MAILEGDIKLLKSAVMADTADGGGAMTGVELVDGLSNGLFPDTSEVNRAFGNVSIRKLFGVAHTDSVDTLLGSHGIVVEAPADPLVHVSLMQTTNWSDTRSAAQEVIERYVVKSSAIGPRILETHYLGAQQLRLISPTANADFPKGGDAICIIAPDGVEQYVRVTKTTFTSQTFYVIESAGTVEFTATICTCDLGQRLTYDFAGPPATRIATNSAAYAKVYATTFAGGAQFYGIKPLAAPAAIGDLSAQVTSVFTPLVPAATVESPIIDQYPLTARTSLSRTAISNVVLPTITTGLLAGVVLRTPTAIVPKSLTIFHGATAFTDSGTGRLLQGAVVVGAIDYLAKTVTMSAGSPNYGTAAVSVSYSPATPSGATAHSSYTTITAANQGLAYTYAFEPPPAPGTFSLSYMAQGRWYELQDLGDGKVAGSDSAYGVGTLSYTTGSIAFTLGAIPDIGSLIIYQWGDAATAVQVLPASLPLQVSASLQLTTGGIPASLSVAWSAGGVLYNAAMTDGQLTGEATGRLTNSVLEFVPKTVPTGDVTVSFQLGTNTADTYSNSSTKANTSLFPVVPRSTSFTMLVASKFGYDLPSSIACTDDGNGILISTSAGSEGAAVGSINYTTGALTFAVSVPMESYENVVTQWTNGATFYYVKKVKRLAVSVGISPAEQFRHTKVGSGMTSIVVTPIWKIQISILAGLKLKTDGMTFSLGGVLYSAVAGVLKSGWSALTGLATVESAGAVTTGGRITFSALTGGTTNAVTWSNVAHDVSSSSVGQGTFRTASAPLKPGVFQLKSGSAVSSTANDSGVISGGLWSGTVDYTRGIVKWSRTLTYVGATYTQWTDVSVAADSVSYNAVFLQYLPIKSNLLGLETARLPLDGKVPIYRPGDLQVVHNTQTYLLPTSLVKGTAYSVGRVRLAAIKVTTTTGATVSSSKYSTNLDAGTITFAVTADITGLSQPFTVAHRIEDLVVCSVADISGKLSFTKSLTHAYPADTSFVSSALVFGDLFGRVYNPIEQETWTGVWSNSLIGSATTANFNETLYPPTTTNRGAITERWALIFTNTTAYRIVGESSGEIGTGTTGADCSPINPATGVAYFNLPAVGWGNGWRVGNVYRFNTAACGAPLHVVRTVLQGPATVQDDKFSLAFRGDVDRV